MSNDIATDSTANDSTISYLQLEGDQDEQAETDQYPNSQPRSYEWLSSAVTSILCLEERSLVDLVETDGEYVISAGQDPDINLWDAVGGTHIRRLSGHAGPVTGLYFYHEQKPKEEGENNTSEDIIIISASEDGTIRQWSARKGEELKRFETDSVITCMGIMNNVLAVTGNSKGLMEVRHLSSGQLYCSILAHFDPIDALVVDNACVCTAVCESPPSLKIWELHWGQIVCVYSKEEVEDVNFSAVSICNSLLILGDAREQRLQVLNYNTGEKWLLESGRTAAGYVQNVKVTPDLIMSCSLDKNDGVFLDVYSMQTFEKIRSFNCNMEWVKALTLVEYDHLVKFVLGGSALALLNVEDSSTENGEEDSLSRFTHLNASPSSKVKHQRKGLFTLKNIMAENDEYHMQIDERLGSKGKKSNDKHAVFDYTNFNISSDKINVANLHAVSQQMDKVELCRDERAKLLERIKKLSLLSSYKSSDQLNNDENLQWSNEPQRMLTEIDELLNKDSTMHIQCENSFTTEFLENCSQTCSDNIKLTNIISHDGHRHLSHSVKKPTMVFENEYLQDKKFPIVNHNQITDENRKVATEGCQDKKLDAEEPILKKKRKIFTRKEIQSKSDRKDNDQATSSNSKKQQAKNGRKHNCQIM